MALWARYAHANCRIYGVCNIDENGYKQPCYKDPPSAPKDFDLFFHPDAAGFLKEFNYYCPMYASNTRG